MKYLLILLLLFSTQGFSEKEDSIRIWRLVKIKTMSGINEHSAVPHPPTISMPSNHLASEEECNNWILRIVSDPKGIFEQFTNVKKTWQLYAYNDDGTEFLVCKHIWVRKSYN
jgi:hypothetical protein